MLTGQLAIGPTAAFSKASSHICSRLNCRSAAAAASRPSFEGSRRAFRSLAPPSSRRAPARLHSGVTCATKKTPKSAEAAEASSAAGGEDTPSNKAKSPAETKPKRAAKSRKAATPEPKAVASDAAPVATSGAAPAVAANEDSTAQYGDFVEVHFTCFLKDGREYETTRESIPLLYQLGNGTVVEGFDKAVVGLSPGGKRTRVVPIEEAYGEFHEEYVLICPRSEGPPDAKVGSNYMIQNEEGSAFAATVTGLDEEDMALDFNHELAGQELKIDCELISLRKGSTLQMATFAAGRFWGPQLRFERLPGVLETSVGYSQGESAEVDYKEVVTGSTGHAEVVQMTFDPKDVSYEQLLDSFFECHDPTQLNRQGEDIGSHYRSGIYTHNEQQAALAKAHISKLNDKLGGTVVTEVQNVTNFVLAEDEMQHYLACGAGDGNKPQSAEKGCTDPIQV